MKIWISRLCFFALLISLPVQAAEPEARPPEQPRANPFHVLVEPLLGYETLSRSYPIEHRQGIFVYGARVVVGTSELAGEGSVQYGQGSEAYASPNLAVTTSLWQVRLGARTIYPLLDEVHVLFRAGEQASHFSNEVNLNGVVNTHSPAWVYRPYVGAGLIFYLFNSLSFSVEETYVFDTTWETGFGFRFFL